MDRADLSHGGSSGSSHSSGTSTPSNAKSLRHANLANNQLLLKKTVFNQSHVAEQLRYGGIPYSWSHSHRSLRLSCAIHSSRIHRSLFAFIGSEAFCQSNSTTNTSNEFGKFDPVSCAWRHCWLPMLLWETWWTILLLDSDKKMFKSEWRKSSWNLMKMRFLKELEGWLWDRPLCFLSMVYRRRKVLIKWKSKLFWYAQFFYSSRQWNLMSSTARLSPKTRAIKSISMSTMNRLSELTGVYTRMVYPKEMKLSDAKTNLW